MLSELVIADTGSYSGDAQRLHGLREVNFVFGANGSGKTTISRVLASPVEFPTCIPGWLHNRPLECVVYNSDFTSENFSAATAPGIFTLGRNNVETQDQIIEMKRVISGLSDGIDGLLNNRDGVDRKSGKVGQLGDLRAAFEESCWVHKVTHDAHFSDAFDGVRGNKAKFCDRVIQEHASNSADVHSIDALKVRAAQVFEKGIERIAALPSIGFDDLIALEAEPVLDRKVVGKEDIDVAALIRRLAEALEALMGLAARTGRLRTRPGPRDEAMRRARVCYDHLAGSLSVRLVFFQTLDVDQARISAALVTVQIAPRGGETEVVLTHQAVYFEGADGPAMRRTGWEHLLDLMASTTQSA